MRAPLTLILGLAAALMISGCQASACVGSGCNTTSSGEIDTVKAQTTIRALIAGQTGASVASVTCPGPIIEQKGAQFTCTATGVDGTTVPVAVVQTDGNGNVHISAPQLLHTGAAAALIASHLTATLKFKVTVRCPDLLNVHPGSKFACKATDPTGDTRSVAVTVKDAQGTIDYHLAK